MHTPELEDHRIFGEDRERYSNIRLVLNDDNYGTWYLSSLPYWGSFIIDKTHVQYVWLTYFICTVLFTEGHIKNSKHCKPVAYNKHKIEIQQHVICTKSKSTELCYSDFRS